MLGRVTDFVSSPRGKWITLLVWIVLAGVLISQLPRLAEVTENEQALFLPEDAESTRAFELERERFPSADGTAHADRRPRTRRTERADVRGRR